MSTSHARSGKLSFEALLNLANAGEHKKVVNATRELKDQSTESLQYRLLRGASLVSLKKFDEAFSCLLVALEISPNNVDALSLAGTCLARTGKFEDAIHYFKMAYRLRPDMLIGQTLLRAALSAEGHDQLVETVFRTLYPKFFQSNKNRYVAIAACISLREWCAAHNPQVMEIEPSATIELTTYDGTPLEPYDSKSVNFVVIPDAKAVAGWDFVISPTGEVLSDTGYMDIEVPFPFMPHITSLSRNSVAYVGSRDVITLDEDVLFLSTSENYHFGHWITDILPRLVAWPHLNQSTTKIFIPANLPQQHRDILALFGLSRNDLVEGELGDTYCFRSLIVYCGHHPYVLNPTVARFLHQALAPKSTPPTAPHSETGVFLERSQTIRGRNIVNQAEFDAFLSEFGFRKVRRPELSIAEQSAIFGNAEIVMGVFGTDMVTAFQMRAGSDLVVFCFEDMEKSGVDDAIRYVSQLCAIVGMRIHLVPCRSSGKREAHSYLDDIVIDCDSFKSILQNIIHRRTSSRISK
jgi:hypothetical protein